LFSIVFLVGVGIAGPAALAFEKFAVMENMDLRLGSLERRILRLALERTPLTQVELGGLFAKGPTPSLADAKLLDRLIEQSARQSGGDPARLRADYARDMSRTILVALGEGDKAKRIAAAVERFFLHCGRLRIALTAPQAFAVMDLLKSPPEILQELVV